MPAALLFEMAKEQLIYGIRAIIETVRSGNAINKVLLQDGLKNPLISELRALLAQEEIPYQFVPQVKLNKITTKNHQGAIAFASTVIFQEIEDLIAQVFER